MLLLSLSFPSQISLMHDHRLSQPFGYEWTSSGRGLEFNARRVIPEQTGIFQVIPAMVSFTMHICV